MPYPSVTPLPEAASRINDPANFGGEAQVFLAAFTTWRTQSNSLASYVNTAPLNIWNWGTLADINPMQVLLATISALPVAAGLAWAGTQDTLWATMKLASNNQNGLGAFVDAVGALTGPATDPDRVSASLMTMPPTRGQARADFNSTSGTFYQSARTYQVNLNLVSDYFYLAISPDDYGVIGDTITATDDWGIL